MARRASVLAAGLAALAAGCGGGEPRSQPPPARTATTPPAAAQAPRTLVLVRRRDGLPARWVRRVRRSPAADAVAEVARTQLALRRSAAAGGRVADTAPTGHAFPLDALVVAPRAYGRALEGEPRAALRRLRRGRV